MTDFAYRITAEIDGFRRAFGEAQAVARQASDGIGREMTRVQSTFDGLRMKLLLVTGVLAGGNLFKSTIDAAVNMQIETGKLSREFGITQSRALALRFAVTDMHVPLEVLSSATAKLSAGLGDGGTKFEKLGIKVKDSNGQFLDLTSIMANANARILQMKEGADRNAVAAQVYGKGWQEVGRILTLTQGQIDAAAQKVKDLGIELDPQQIADYRNAMNDAGDVVEALQVRIGSQLLPALTDLARWFSESGPAASNIFVQGLKHLIQFVDETVLAIRLVWNDLATGMEKIAKRLETLGAIARAAATGQWDAIKQLWQAGTAELQAMESKWLAQYYRLNREHLERVEKLWGKHRKAKNEAPSPGGTQGAADALGDGKGKPAKTPERASRMGQWEAERREFEVVQAELARRQGQFHQASLTEEQLFWQGKLAMAKGNGQAEVAERAAVLTKIHGLKLAQFRQEFEAELAANKSLEVEAQNNAARRVAIAEQEIALIGQRYGANSKQYAEAEARLTQIKREALTQRQAMELSAMAVERDRVLASIDMAEADAQARASLQQISFGQLLQLQEQFEIQRAEIRARYAQLERANVDPDRDPVAYQQRTAQIQQLEIDHQVRLAEIRRQAALAQQNDPMNSVWSSASDSFGQAIDEMIFKGQTLRQSLQNIFRSIFNTFMQEMVTKPLMAAAARAIKESSLYQAMFGIQTTQQAAASSQIVATKASEATAVVGANAAEGASGAAASQAAIPFVGPVLAIAAFAAIMALILGAKSQIKSAAGGYDIPAGVNPMTQLHEQEMVLPKAEANAVREMARAKRAPGGENMTVVNNFILDGEVDERTQGQIARDVGVGIQRYMSRMG